MPTQPLAHRCEGVKLSSIRKVSARIEEAARQGISIANFAAGRPDFDSPAHVKLAARQAMEQGKVHYAKSIGLDDLREAVARRLGQDFRLEIDPQRILITMGGTGAMHAALMSILNPGDEVLVPQPMYVYYEGWINLCGASMVPVPLLASQDFALKADHIRTRLTPHTKAIIINSPHNPTGQVFAEEDLREIAALAREADFYLVCDEVYNYLLYEDARHFPPAAIPGMQSHTIMCGSLSKTYAMDGWRVGYLIGPQEVMRRALLVHQYSVACVNTFVQIGARAAMEESQQWVHDMLQELARRRLFMLSCLDEMNIPYVRPRGAFYVFPDISRFGYGSQRFSDFLFSQAQLAVVPGDAFGPGGQGRVRMAYCLPYPEIERGMERMRQALARL